jgi:polar amino acid transport system ATP-binding protein
MNADIALSIENGRKAFGERIVFSDLTVQFPRHAISVLYGPSGIGKTTLLQCAVLLRNLDHGCLYVNGELAARDGNISNEQVVRRHVGVVFQDFYLWDNKTALENVTEALIHVRGMSEEAAITEARRITEELHVRTDLLDQFPPELSRGQRQRIAIARTLVMDPEIILFDEPTASLDEELVDYLAATMRKLKRDGKTLIVVSHDKRFVEAIGDLVIDMRNPSHNAPRSSSSLI